MLVGLISYICEIALGWTKLISSHISTKMKMQPVLFSCIVTLLLSTTCESHGGHDDYFDPDAPPENRLNREGFINNIE